ncbi:hypothetical protein DW1_1152 [Proteiniborus sp. DW1]|uniref:hypothetical protein n=1 Tax=Proteiniborus sp. DW1 TaxID=1889883 RepID=UPI00092E1450|nr:hypothetical protein [Proteiniborus sp. DW1]SCG82725.1 hypothetical protein DW1_1152 [Proteiniborus sp. DW1]
MDSQLTIDIFNFIKGIPIDLISSFFTSGVAVFIVTYYFYKSSVKWRHRQVMVADDVSKLLRNILKFTLVVPLLILLFLWVMLYAKIDTLIFIMIIIIALDILIVYSYIRTTGKKYKVNTLKNKLRKFTRIFFRYILAVILLFSIAPINIFFVLFFYITIIDFSQLGLEIVDFILTLIAFYFYSPSIIFLICSTHEEGLKKKIKTVTIFYNQNGKRYRDSNIEFENFDINKDFVSFYSHTKKRKRIIQTKDLLRIEYYYAQETDEKANIIDKARS